MTHHKHVHLCMCMFTPTHQHNTTQQAGAEDRGNMCHKTALDVAKHKAHPRCQKLLVRTQLFVCLSLCVCIWLVGRVGR